ncbi:glycosyltransferase family A protein [Falsiroseomonas tokyonensis]|uniref:Glycosyltransferase n=1 Tax=Falsiroseomonas tokyonensis TaxID=430521 RepID=A0ABV7C370_9PROT|nr:glycosyltransferase family A protein [Falsiroseomonas tokyonensis]MBU8541080.1 glycosyltransferase family 2 protein [Falsiroseomonas tokyonensis]
MIDASKTETGLSQAYAEAATLLRDPASLSGEALAQAALQVMDWLWALPDPEATCALFRQTRDRVPAGGAPAEAVVPYLLRGAAALFATGASAEARTLLQGLIASRPDLLPARRLLAAGLRAEAPDLALSTLAALRDTPAFQKDAAAVALYLDLLLRNRRSGLAHLEASRLQASLPAPELMLLLANAEPLATDRLVLLNAFFESQQLAPLALRQAAPGGRLLDGFAWPWRGAGDGPLVSVLMVATDAAATLATSLAALQAQSHGNWEALVVDNASTDATAGLLRGLAQQDKRIRPIVQAKRLAAGAALNLALQAAAGEFVLCHGASLVSHPDRLKLEVAALAAQPSLLAGISQVVQLDWAGQALAGLEGGFRQPHRASPLFRRAEVVRDIGHFAAIEEGAEQDLLTRIVGFRGAASLVQLPQALALAPEAKDGWQAAPAALGPWLDWLAACLAEGRAPLILPDGTPGAGGDGMPDPLAAARDASSCARLSLRPAAVASKGALITTRTSASTPAGLAPGAHLRPVLHVADLGADSQLVTLLLNHAVIEQRQGLRSQVWNILGTAPKGFCWQAQRLRAAGLPILEEAPEEPASLFIYGRRLLDRLADVPPPPAGSEVVVLVATPAEVAEASKRLAKLGLAGRVLPANFALFVNRPDLAQGQALQDRWDVALATNLFGESRPATELGSIGVSLHGQVVSEADLAFIEALRAATGTAPIVLVDPDSKDRLAGSPARVVLASRGRNFWNDFFADVTLLVERDGNIAKLGLLSGVAQSILRRRPVVLVTAEDTATPGLLAFPSESEVLGFLGGLSRNPGAYAALVKTAQAELGAHLGDGFHLQRLRELEA